MSAFAYRHLYDSAANRIVIARCADRTIKWESASIGWTQATDLPGAAHNGPSSGRATVGTTPTPTTTWFHWGGRFYDSHTDAEVFYAGASEGDEQTTHGPSIAMGEFVCGDPFNSSSVAAGEEFSLAEVGVWSVNLSDDEWLALGDGVSPLLVRPSALEMYYPFLNSSDLICRVTGTVLSATGTPTDFDHPPVLYPSSPRVFVGAAGGATYDVAISEGVGLGG